VAAVSLEAVIAAIKLGGNGSHRPYRSVDELAAGTGGSIDAVTGAAICPYWKSRSREI